MPKEITNKKLGSASEVHFTNITYMKYELPSSWLSAETQDTHVDPPETVKLEEWFARRLQLKTKVGREALRIAIENVVLLDRKQQDYGPGNIAAFGQVGIVIRMNDKFERIKTIIKSKSRRAKNESIEDSFRDLCNYSIIAVMWLKKLWPGSGE